MKEMTDADELAILREVTQSKSAKDGGYCYLSDVEVKFFGGTASPVWKAWRRHEHLNGDTLSMHADLATCIFLARQKEREAAISPREKRLEEAIKDAQHLLENYGYASDRLEATYNILERALSDGT